MSVRIIIVICLFALDYLSLSSAARAAREGGNEYIQAALPSPSETRSPSPRPARRGGFAHVRWFIAGSIESDESPCDFSEKPFQSGTASWYGPGFHGRPMANQKPYDMHAATVAHKRLPLGTRVCIRNPANERVVVATVTDRGPYVEGRIVDLSKGVASALDIDGLGRVEIFVI